MKISEHSIISNEYLQNRIDSLKKEIIKYQEEKREDDETATFLELATCLEIQKQLLPLMPLCDKIFESGANIGEDYIDSNSNIDFVELKNNYLNNHIKID